MAKIAYLKPSGGSRRLLDLLLVSLALTSPVFAAGPPAGVGPDEWAGIQTQIEAERHKVVESDRPGRLYRADNPTQRFTAHFGAEDVVIEPVGSGEPAWHLGLRLTAWGAADDLKQVEFAHVTAEGNRIEFRRGPLTEWYVNTTMGLEQGFTIDAPPGDGIDELVLEMTLDTNLTAELAGDERTVTFLREGARSLTYSGLKAWDAMDEPLAARVELVGKGSHLKIAISTEDAAWPVTVDPVFSLLQRILSPLDPDPQSGPFGFSIDLDGDWMVVGQLGEVGYGKVGAHLYHRNGGHPAAWEHVVEIEPDDDDADWDHVAVAISGDVVVIGVPGSAPSGKAYVFRRDHGGPDAWGQVATINPIDSSARQFGVSVAASGEIVVVGASSTDQSNGAAYVYRSDLRGFDAWEQIKKIPNPDPSGGLFFGSSVSLDGETTIIGKNSGSAHVFYRNQGGADSWGHVAATSLDGRAVAVSGEIAVIGEISSGVGGGAHVFARDHGGPDSWGHVRTISGHDTGDSDRFGISVDIEQDTIVIGASFEDSGGEHSGAAYFFERNHGGPDAWGQVAKIEAADASSFDAFGTSATISGDTAVIGSMQYRFDDYEYSGAVYVFERNQGGASTWGETAKIPSPPFLSAWYNHFGTSVDIDGDTAVVGSPKKRGWVHIYQRTPSGSGVWERSTRTTADNDDWPWQDHFGFSTAISGDSVIVGAYGDNESNPPSTIYDVGSAYVFQRNAGGVDNWGVVARLFADTWKYFGYSVALDGDTAIVGGDGNLYYGFPPAHVFQRDHGGPGAWGHVAELVPGDAGAYAPNRRVALSHDTAVVGWFGNGLLYVFERDEGGLDAWGETARIDVGQWGGGFDISADTLIAGHYSISDPAAHVYRRDQGGPGNWGLVARITPPDGIVDQHFGTSVSINGDVAAVGSWDAATNNEPGAVYFFQRRTDGTDAWDLLSSYSDSDNSSKFGRSVSVSGGLAIVGAPEDHEIGVEAGAAYVFELRDGFFADGFESGDTSVWAVTIP